MSCGSCRVVKVGFFLPRKTRKARKGSGGIAGEWGISNERNRTGGGIGCNPILPEATGGCRVIIRWSVDVPLCEDSVGSTVMNCSGELRPPARCARHGLHPCPPIYLSGMACLHFNTGGSPPLHLPGLRCKAHRNIDSREPLCGNSCRRSSSGNR